MHIDQLVESIYYLIVQRWLGAATLCDLCDIMPHNSCALHAVDNALQFVLLHSKMPFALHIHQLVFKMVAYPLAFHKGGIDAICPPNAARRRELSFAVG